MDEAISKTKLEFAQRIIDGEDIVSVWADALESGEYLQGIETLRHDNEFCCLGVLCDLHKLVTGSGTWVEVSHLVPATYQVKDGELVCAGTTTLPIPVQVWAGLATPTGRLNTPVVGKKRGFNWLTELNDGGYSFLDIAKEIRSGNVTLVRDE